MGIATWTGLHFSCGEDFVVLAAPLEPWSVDTGTHTYVQDGFDEATSVLPVVDGQGNRFRGTQLPDFGLGQRVPAVVSWRNMSGGA